MPIKNKDLKKFLKNTQLEVKKIGEVWKLQINTLDIKLDQVYFVDINNIPLWSLNDNPLYIKIGYNRLATFDKEQTYFLNDEWLLIKWNEYYNGKLDTISEGIFNNKIIPCNDKNIKWLEEILIENY